MVWIDIKIRWRQYCKDEWWKLWIQNSDGREKQKKGGDKNVKTGVGKYEWWIVVVERYINKVKTQMCKDGWWEIGIGNIDGGKLHQ